MSNSTILLVLILTIGITVSAQHHSLREHSENDKSSIENNHLKCKPDLIYFKIY